MARHSAGRSRLSPRASARRRAGSLASTRLQPDPSESDAALQKLCRAGADMRRVRTGFAPITNCRRQGSVASFARPQRTAQRTAPALGVEPARAIFTEIYSGGQAWTPPGEELGSSIAKFLMLPPRATSCSPRCWWRRSCPSSRSRSSAICRIGRKNMYMIGAVVTGVFGFVYFGMLNTGVATVIFLAIVLSLIPHDTMYGPQAALIAESFTGRLRYSGSSLGYQLASVIAGGPAPLIATALLARYHSWTAIAWYITACAVISIIAVAMMRDYTGKDIAGEYAT